MTGQVHCSSHSLEKSPEEPAEAAPRLPIALHRLRVLDQANGGRELGIFKRAR
jgi:hypothetical protein